jgi:hypothetical protein
MFMQDTFTGAESRQPIVSVPATCLAGSLVSLSQEARATHPLVRDDWEWPLPRAWRGFFSSSPRTIRRTPCQD